ncbi:LPXTG cell wall anchor domain-containing protein [Actinoplanes sp. G11-F43]|uniref:LPXTG cell wall anchor domain-containing protein n=1 Tax=Actinoplanes sp. G11-F43 TaxID=3424130 RepID=UPI003D3572FD
MRRTIPAGALLALALLIPTAPAAAAQADKPGLDAACQTVERKLFTDIRKLVTIDLDTATVAEVRITAFRVLDAAETDSLYGLPDATQKALGGTDEDLRAFLGKGMLSTWTHDLRISVGQTLKDAGADVEKAAQKTLDDGSIDAALAYLNDGLWAARELDCAAQPSPSASVSASASPGASVTPSATTTGTAGPSATTTPGGGTGEGGEGGGLPVTGAAAGTVAGVGGALLVLGGAGFLIGRRRRARFEA